MNKVAGRVLTEQEIKVIVKSYVDAKLAVTGSTPGFSRLNPKDQAFLIQEQANTAAAKDLTKLLDDLGATTSLNNAALPAIPLEQMPARVLANWVINQIGKTMTRSHNNGETTYSTLVNASTEQLGQPFVKLSSKFVTMLRSAGKVELEDGFANALVSKTSRGDSEIDGMILEYQVGLKKINDELAIYGLDPIVNLEFRADQQSIHSLLHSHGNDLTKAREEFTNFLTPKLNMPKDSAGDYFDYVVEQMAGGIHTDPNRIIPPSLKFNTGADMMAAARRFGGEDMNMNKLIYGQIRMASERIADRVAFGSGGSLSIRNLLADHYATAVKDGNIALQKELYKALVSLEVVTGFSRPALNNVDVINKGLLSSTRISLLGVTNLSGFFTDMANSTYGVSSIYATSAVDGVRIGLSVLGHRLKNIFTSPDPTSKQHFQIGVEQIFNQNTPLFAPIGQTRGVGHTAALILGRMAKSLHSMTLGDTLIRSNKEAITTVSVHETISSIKAANNFESLTPELRIAFEASGITKQEFDIYKQALVSNDDILINLESVDLSNYVPTSQTLMTKDSALLRSVLKLKLRGFITDQVNMSQIASGSLDSKAAMARGSWTVAADTANTSGNIVTRYVMPHVNQFASYSHNATTKSRLIGKRVAEWQKVKGAEGGWDTAKATSEMLVNSATVVAYLSAFGVGALWARDVVKGRDFIDANTDADGEFNAWTVVGKGALLGTAIPKFVIQLTLDDGIGVGPGPGAVLGVGAGLSAAGYGVVQDDEEITAQGILHAQKEAIKLVPYQNAPGVALATHKLKDYLEETANPRYKGDESYYDNK